MNGNNAVQPMAAGLENGESTEKELQAKALAQIANVSKLFRDAIGASLPVAPEQYMTISIPGTTIDIRDIQEGGTFVYDAASKAFPPDQVRQEEARLVDNMLPLASVMIGNTGRSVSRSYSLALDGLIPRKATVMTGANEILSPGNQVYDEAMKYLTSKNPITGYTPVDVYVGKQKLWSEAQEAWEKAKLEAQKEAKEQFRSDVAGQRQYFADWNKVNYLRFKSAVHGQYMDWSTNGFKYNVEYNFGMIDVDSVMARVENSKESMRNSIIPDPDGNEIQGVNLTPRNWATICKQKLEGWFRRNDEYSLDQVEAEIARLQRLQDSYIAMKEITSTMPPTYPRNNLTKQPTPTLNDSSVDVKAKYKALYEAEAKMNDINAELAAQATEQEKADFREKADFKTAVGALDTARKGFKDEVDKNHQVKAVWAEYNTAALERDSKQSMQTWLTNVMLTIQTEIDGLQTKRSGKLAKTPVTAPAIAGAHNGEDSKGTDFAQAGSERAHPRFGLGNVPSPGSNLPSAGTASDPWTSISFSFSAADQKSTATTSEWGMSVGGEVGWGLWSVGGSYAHDSSSSSSVADMASCDVSVSFSALVVNIGRPWLYAELFNDFQLDVIPGLLLSPGAQELHQLMREQKATGDGVSSNQAVVNKLAQYQTFPSFPTSFVVAADTTIEFHGDTKHIEDHFSASSNSGSLSVGYGPFTVRSSFEQSSSSQSHQMQSTATGCKLTFGAPQIIGWVSQILPSLPRKPDFEPMVQNVVTTP